MIRLKVGMLIFYSNKNACKMAKSKQWIQLFIYLFVYSS